MGIMDAGLPSRTKGMKSKLFTTTQVINPATFAPGVTHFILVYGGGGGSGYGYYASYAPTPGLGGAHGQMFETPWMEITGPVTATIGAGGAHVASGVTPGAAGGDTTLTWTNKGGAPGGSLKALGALAGQFTPYMTMVTSLTFPAGGFTPTTAFKVPTYGQSGRINAIGIPIIQPAMAVSGGDGTLSISMTHILVGGYQAGAPGVNNDLQTGCGAGGWRGAGGASNSNVPAVGYSAGAGCATNSPAGVGGDAGGGFVEFFWLEA